MYIINDLDFLVRLNKFGVIDHLMLCCSIGVSVVRLNDYSSIIKKQVSSVDSLVVLQLNEDFENWFITKRAHFSIGELSSIYLTLGKTDNTLIVSNEDQLLIEMAIKNGVKHLQFDKLVEKFIKDEKVLKMYNLLKIAS